jgi:Carboxypeptidase regulatory-like domain
MPRISQSGPLMSLFETVHRQSPTECQKHADQVSKEGKMCRMALGVFKFAAVVALSGSLALLSAQSSSGSLEGQVADPSGAAVSGAAVQVTEADGRVRRSVTDIQGRYRFGNLPPGIYRVRITSSGFKPFEDPNIDIAAGTAHQLTVRLQIEESKQNVTISDATSQVGVDPSQNVGQIVLRGDDLDAFSDDPEDLANELQMLAGPSPGPDGGQIYIDGFSAGIMPPKASIREIRVNQNPFSSESRAYGTQPVPGKSYCAQLPAGAVCGQFRRSDFDESQLFY